MCRIKNLTIEPFSKFSAEEELDVLSDIFYKPPFYNELLNLLEAGNSRFILGQRGQGKSAIIYKLLDDLSRKQVLPILITRYDRIPLSNNAAHFLHIICVEICKNIAKCFFKDKKLVKALNKDQKRKFNRLIEYFYDKNWAEQFVEEAKVIKNKKRKNWFIRLFNKNIHVINEIADGAVQITSDLIRKSIFGDTVPSGELTKHGIFSEVEEAKFNCKSISDVVPSDRDDYISVVKVLLEIAITIGKNSIIILFDKIDENPILESDVERISTFMKDILSDTDFLYTTQLGIVFALWTEIKRNLNTKNIRFDKFKDIDIRWSDEELENLINFRLKYYSKDQSNPVTLKILIPDNNQRKTIIELAGKSPRSLLSLLSSIYYADSRSEILSFSTESIIEGTKKFCKEFDYISLMPSNVSKRDDLYNWINKLLSIRKQEFVVKDYASAVNVKENTANTHINELKKLQLIKISQYPSENGEVMYYVSDPRLRHLISRNVLFLE